MHTFTPYMLMKDNFGAEFLICDKLRANAQTLSGSRPAQNKKSRCCDSSYLVRETGLDACCGCALHADGSPTVAYSDSTRLTAPR